MFDGEKSTSMEGQPPYDNEETRVKIKAKLQRVIDKGYMEFVDIEYVESFMYMFHVPKREEDIQMV